MTLERKSAADKGRDFRALHAAPGAIRLPNPWDVGSAKVLESLGFKALATTSGGFAWSIGKLDGAVSLDEKLAHCEALCNAVDIPITADLGPGFGESPEAIAETVRRAGGTGLSGCSIEDAANPYFGDAYEFDAAVARVAAAVEAARALPHDFLLTARCEEFATGKRNLDEAIRRLSAYEEAGADVLYAPGVTTIDEIRAICDAVSKPVNVLIGFRQFTVPTAELEAAGVKRISLGTDLARIAYGAAMNAAKEFAQTGTIEDADIEARSKDIAASFV